MSDGLDLSLELFIKCLRNFFEHCFNTSEIFIFFISEYIYIFFDETYFANFIVNRFKLTMVDIASTINTEISIVHKFIKISFYRRLCVFSRILVHSYKFFFKTSLFKSIVLEDFSYEPASPGH